MMPSCLRAIRPTIRRCFLLQRAQVWDAPVFPIDSRYLRSCNARAGGGLYEEIHLFSERDFGVVIYCREHSGRYPEKANKLLPEMDTDADSEPSQETNADSSSEETHSHAAAGAMAPAHTHTDT